MAHRLAAPPPDEVVDAGDDVRLATWTTRHPDADTAPLVLVHGGPGLWDYLGDLADLVTGVSVVHRYDQRGCGRSSAGVPQSFAHSIADLETLREHWGHDRWVVVGHSFGADLALAYAATHPDRVAALGYLSGVGIGDWRTPLRSALTEARRRIGPDTEHRLAALDALTERTWDEEVEFRTLSWATDHRDPVAGLELARPMAETDLPIRWDVNRALMVASDAQKIAWAQAIGCPTFVIHGSADPRPAATALDLGGHLARPRKRIVQDAGHLPWTEQPDETADLVREVVHAAT